MYDIELSYNANKDFDDYINTITIDFDSPITAAKHYKEISDKINSLKTNAESYPVRNTPSFIRYGLFVRRLNYKKMAIIYTIRSKTVYIHRIIPSSLIT